jgi:hypothetical protein
MMHGPGIVVRSFVVRPFGKLGYRAQYHQQSDAHSRTTCWGVLFDLALESELLRRHAELGKIVFGVNHAMSDFKTHREKKLDLVIATPGSGPPGKKRTFANLGSDFGVVLDVTEASLLESLPTLQEGPVGSVLVALEAKATMTAHVKALPRLYDELNSSHLTVHGAAEQAIAVGTILVNFATKFLTLDRNLLGVDSSALSYNLHKQPTDAKRRSTRSWVATRTSPGAGRASMRSSGVELANDDRRLILRRPAGPRSGISTSTAR